MIVFFIILIILFLISLMLLILCLSNLEVEIKKLWFDSTNEKHKKLQNYNIFIRIKLFDKITWFKFKIDSDKMVKIKNSNFFNSKMLKKFNNIQNIKKFISRNKKEIFNLKNLQELDINIKKLDLKIKLSALDNMITSFSVAIISSIISIILARSIKKYDKDKYYYRVTPIYEYKPIFKIKLNCIIDIKIVHIMNIIYILLKKRSVENNERTSNRRTYVCGNE